VVSGTIDHVLLPVEILLLREYFPNRDILEAMANVTRKGADES
jgi:hypothetical protein